MSRSPWTPRQLDLLRKHYPNQRAIDLVSIVGHSKTSIYGKAKQLGLRKSEEFLNSALSGRTDGKRGAAGRFKKGVIPWNTGIKGVATGGKDTQFKKGTMPHNWLPIGSYRISGDGYLEVKFSDDPGPPNHRWKPVHRTVWEEANGAIPNTHKVVFKPGMKTTVLEEITVDRLELLSHAELMHRNTIHNYPDTLVKAMQLKGALVRKINRRGKKHG